MIRWQQVKTIARAEMRLTRRLARYWIFLSLSYLIAIAYYLVYSVLHGSFSTYSATVGVLSPRFLISAVGFYYLFFYIVGTIFLAFDLRARDTRERVSEVLDSRPYTNLELVIGRFFGILLPSWIPILALALFWEILGLILVALGSPIGDTMNLISLFGFVVMMALPALGFALSIVFLVTLMVRNRLAAAVLALALLGINYWATFYLPATYGKLFDVIGYTSLNFPSEISPAMLSLDGWLQRIGIIFATFGLLGFSAAVHPRLDGGSRGKLASGGAGLIILALIFTGIGFYRSMSDIKLAERWKIAHEAAGDMPVPDLQSIMGDVSVKPGRSLDLEIDLTFRAPDNSALETALFTLNPGQKVSKALDATGQPLSFTHENGLLQLTLPYPLAPGNEAMIHLSIKDLPDDRFAFLESAINPGMIKIGSEGNMALLGYAPALFKSRFVALMPALRWLPASGSETGRDDTRTRPIDFYDIDLTVNLPDGWLAAGPGRRRKVEENTEGERFRFSPGAPVPEVALIASLFESRGIEIEGVFMELLVHPEHMKNIALLADTGEKIQSWIGERLREASDNGLGYPYDGLTLVEVPSTLRTFGGGWRMDTVLAQPGMMLMRETDFPMARFDTAFRNPEKFKDREGGIAQAKWELLNTFFNSDVSGGNIFTGSARNFFNYQTAATGPGAFALNYVMEGLSSLLITEKTGYFSVHFYKDQRRMGKAITSTVNTYAVERSAFTSIGDAAMNVATAKPGVWDKMLNVSLKDMDPWENPAQTIDILTLKGNTVARSILDALGHEKTIRLLASLREAHRGGSFTVDGLLAAGKGLGYDLDELVGDWLGSTTLPGFVCSEAKAYRLPDSADGNPRYQLLLTIRNDEPAPGVFRFITSFSNKAGTGRISASPALVFTGPPGKPIRLAGKSAIRYGKVVSQSPWAVILDPYLSHNRERFNIELPSIDPEKIEKVDAIEGIEEIPWALPEEPFIVVDDLDNGFQAFDSEKSKGLRISAREDDSQETDQGLPIAQSAFRIPSDWSRITRSMSWGKYRHTIAAVKSGDGEKKAAFTSTIPQAGEWDLEVYIPAKQTVFPGRRWGTWHMTIKDSNGDEHEITFDSNGAAEGWNLSESFDFPEGEVSVTLSNETDGQFVIADAIRWSPSARN